VKKDAVKLVITKRAFESALESSRATFPNEFIGLFRGKEKTVKGLKTVRLSELIIAPFSDYGDGYSTFSDIFLPLHIDALASFHSHPRPPAAPSRGDLHFFSRKGKYHFIACPPFDWRASASGSGGRGERCVRAFDSRGSELDFQVVDK